LYFAFQHFVPSALRKRPSPDRSVQPNSVLEPKTVSTGSRLRGPASFAQTSRITDVMVENSGRDQRAASGATDEELMLRYRNQADSDAFDELVHRYERELYSYLYRYLGDAGLAEEVFQATFLRLHQSRKLYQEGKRLRPWLYSIATHQAIDALRKAGRQPKTSLDRSLWPDQSPDGGKGSLLDLLEAETPTPLVQAENAEHRAWMREAVNRLPEHLRSVVLLVYFQGLKYNEAAEILQIAPGTVKSRLHAAVAKLNAEWKQWQAV